MGNNLWSLILDGLSSRTSAGHGGGGRGDAGVQSRVVDVGGASYTFQIFLPKGFAGRENLPLILFLHGIGHRGSGGYVPTAGARGAVIGHYLEQVPALILLPQCRDERYWSDPEMDRMVIRALGQTVEEFKADPARLYLTGVSMGGFGVWHLASQHPGRFAAD